MDIFEALNGKVNVKFKKADGSIRDMLCTRNLSYVPKENHPKGTGVVKSTTDAVRVFDLQKKEWRSFKTSRVISYKKAD